MESGIAVQNKVSSLSNFMRKGTSKNMIKRVVIAVLFFNIVLFGAAYAALSWAMSPVSSNTNKVSFVVPKGSSFNAVSNMLEERGLIRSKFALRFVVFKDKLGSALQAGTFTISESQTPEEIAQTLTKGTNDVWVTFLEGWRVEEMADELGKTLGEGFDKEAFIEFAKPEEGYLFPDTYLIPRLATPETVVNLLRRTFDAKVETGLQSDIQKSGKTLHEVVTLAAILEREARLPKDMKIVAGILENRLQQGIPLQVDCTLQYIKGYDSKEKTWWPTPYAEDKAIKSPYNTYLNRGLPPGPIANPSLAAVSAVLHPEPSDYLYYISDMQGGMHYAKTLQEHNANVQKYLR